jgi:outer membrane immunogenic protein
MQNYRSYLLAGAAALSLGFVSAAQAADPIIYEQPPVMMPAAMYDWSGFYAGVMAGYASGDADWALLGGGPSGSFDMDGAFLGGLIGYNWQTGPWVLGAEADLAWSGIDGGAATFGISSDLEWMGSVRGRVGYAWDNILPYITGGVAFARNEVSVGAFGGASDTNTHIGWTAGLGVEVGVTQNVSASLEYRYTDFGTEDYNFGVGSVAAGTGDFHTIGAALKWRFN